MEKVNAIGKKGKRKSANNHMPSQLDIIGENTLFWRVSCTEGKPVMVSFDDRLGMLSNGSSQIQDSMVQLIAFSLESNI